MEIVYLELIALKWMSKAGYAEERLMQLPTVLRTAGSPIPTQTRAGLARRYHDFNRCSNPCVTDRTSSRVP